MPPAGATRGLSELGGPHLLIIQFEHSLFILVVCLIDLHQCFDNSLVCAQQYTRPHQEVAPRTSWEMSELGYGNGKAPVFLGCSSASV